VWQARWRQTYAEHVVKVTDGFCTSDQCCGDTSSKASHTYKCLDCNGPRYCCKQILESHRYLETHSIQVSSMLMLLLACFLPLIQVKLDGMFKDTSLMDLGLVVQLNHCLGSCPVRETATVVLNVYDINGCHQVRVNYCGCARSISESGNSKLDQIFAQQWFPATWKQPRTVFTFRLLRQFHIINLQSKCNMFDYYQSIVRMRNNAGTKYQPVSDLHPNGSCSSQSLESL
jgi:hypothetical protein